MDSKTDCILALITGFCIKRYIYSKKILALLKKLSEVLTMFRTFLDITLTVSCFNVNFLLRFNKRHSWVKKIIKCRFSGRVFQTILVSVDLLRIS